MQFSEKEKQIISDTDFLKTKISVVEKIHSLFDEIQIQLKNTIVNSDFSFSSNVDTKYGKIFKGENYRSLPYVVLDYPKLFSKEDIFTFRIMFWWGNFFSSTLFLNGMSLDKYKENIKLNIRNILSKDIYIGVGNTPWEYHYQDNNYELLNNNNIKLLDNIIFLKLSKKYELENYVQLPNLASEFLDTLLTLLKK